jgi:hypothetical protein
MNWTCAGHVAVDTLFLMEQPSSAKAPPGHTRSPSHQRIEQIQPSRSEAAPHPFSVSFPVASEAAATRKQTQVEVDAVLVDFERGDIPIRLQDLPKHPLVPRRASRPVHVSVVYRWVTRGLKGHRLESCRCGGSICKSASALVRFFRRLSGIDPTASVPEPRKRNAGLLRAETQLEEAGL